MGWGTWRRGDVVCGAGTWTKSLNFRGDQEPIDGEGRVSSLPGRREPFWIGFSLDEGE